MRTRSRGAIALALLSLASCSRERAPTRSPTPTAADTTREARLPHFDVSGVRLTIVEQALEPRLPLPPGALAAFNGGFFDEGGRAEGYAVSEGRLLAPYDRSLGGGVLVVGDGRAILHDGETFAPPAPPPDFAVQARPRLVVDGAVNIRSETGRRAARTALCLRDEGRSLEVVVRPAPPQAGPTLLELARELAAAGCEDALNLDGGPSTGLVTPTERHLPRGPIRHVLVVAPRSATPPRTPRPR
ncbi:MAG: phosphodiester glycosidase family protein [Myxococcota bacterium]